MSLFIQQQLWKMRYRYSSVGSPQDVFLVSKDFETAKEDALAFIDDLKKENSRSMDDQWALLGVEQFHGEIYLPIRIVTEHTSQRTR